MGGREQQTARAHTNTELDSELVRAEMKQAEAKSRLEQIESILRSRTGHNGAIETDWSSLDASTEVLSSTLMQTLRAQDIRVSGQVAELEDTYGPLHPTLTHAKAEMQDLHERIEQEVQKIFDSVKQEYDSARGRVRVIKEAASRHRQEKIKLNNMKSTMESSSGRQRAPSTCTTFFLNRRRKQTFRLGCGLSMCISPTLRCRTLSQ